MGTKIVCLLTYWDWTSRFGEVVTDTNIKHIPEFMVAELTRVLCVRTKAGDEGFRAPLQGPPPEPAVILCNCIISFSGQLYFIRVVSRQPLEHL